MSNGATQKTSQLLLCCAIRSIVGTFVKAGCVCVRFAARTGRDIVLADARGDPRFNPKLDHDLACGITTSLMYVSVSLRLVLLHAVQVSLTVSLAILAIYRRTLLKTCNIDYPATLQPFASTPLPGCCLRML